MFLVVSNATIELICLIKKAIVLKTDWMLKAAHNKSNVSSFWCKQTDLNRVLCQLNCARVLFPLIRA